MKKSFRIAFATAAVAAGVALAAPSPASAQVRFSGSFPAPHGRVSVRFGDPFFRAGSFVPSRYRVTRHPRYGQGFYYRSRWIPVRSYRSRWVVCDSPVGYSGAYDDGYYDDGYYAPYDGYSSRPHYRPYVYSRPYGYSGFYVHRFNGGHGSNRGGDRGRHGGWDGRRH